MKRLLLLVPFAAILIGLPQLAFADGIVWTALPPSKMIATISADGTSVKIDWETTEKCVATPEWCSDQTMLAIARLMLAIRNQTWEPMK